MKGSRRVKTFMYWVILLGYFAAMFYMWMNFKRESQERNQSRTPNFKVD